MIVCNQSASLARGVTDREIAVLLPKNYAKRLTIRTRSVCLIAFFAEEATNSVHQFKVYANFRFPRLNNPCELVHLFKVCANCVKNSKYSFLTKIKDIL